MKDKPSISIVIPTYNRRHTLARALNSVFGQSLPADEIIVVDDGSTDGSADWLKSHYPELTLLVQSNHGVSHARNTGIRHAHGEWIALLDSDDEWSQDKLKRQIELINENPETQLVHSDEIWVRHGVRVNPMNKYQKAGGNIFQRCLPLCVISPSSTIIKKSVFDQYGLFDESLPACEDYDMWLRLCSRFKVNYIDTPLIFKYGGHPDQLSQQFWGMDRFRIQALEKIIKADHITTVDRQAAIEMLVKKSEILIQGALKRNNLSLVKHYQNIIMHYRPVAQKTLPTLRSCQCS